ncbi:hypothetical protein DFP73DRAFT_526536 [Morchella snyderi]|nr:hypothetical protein DFP73DRAFT_526536 [Morchella snyderi]
MIDKYTLFDWSKNYEWNTWPQLTRSGAGHGAIALSRYTQDQVDNQSFFEGFDPLIGANKASKTVSPEDRKMLLNYLHSTIHEIELPRTRIFEPKPVHCLISPLLYSDWQNKSGGKDCKAELLAPEPKPVSPKPKRFFDWGWLKQSEDGGWEGGPYEFPKDSGELEDGDYKGDSFTPEPKPMSFEPKNSSTREAIGRRGLGRGAK